MSVSPSSQLSKELSGSQLFTLGFGTIIGVGWVIVLGEWLNQAGPLGAIAAFAGGGLVMVLVGLCYGELATLLPVSGGEVAYAYEIYGLKTSFAMGWLLTLAYVATTIFEAISVGWIVGALWPGLQGSALYTIGGEPVQTGSLLLGLGGTALLTFLNYRSVKGATRFQDVLTYGLLGVSAVFIAAGLWGGIGTNLEPLVRTSNSGIAWTGILAVLVTTPFWFAGFNVIPQVMEEKSPGTSLRRAGQIIVLSIVAAGLFYCLVILSASMAIPWQSLLTLELPAAGAFEAAFHSPLLAKFVLVAALLGLLTTWNAVFLASSRVLFALGRARIILPAFGTVHPVFHSPATAVFFVGVVGFCGVFLGRSVILPVVNVAGTCLALGFLLTCLGVIRLRRARPYQERPFRVPGGIAAVSFATVCCALIILVSLYQPYRNARGSFPLEWTFLIVWCGLGGLLWFFARTVRSQVNEKERRKLILGAIIGAE